MELTDDQIVAHLTLHGWVPVGVGIGNRAKSDPTAWRGVRRGNKLVWWYLVPTGAIGAVEVADISNYAMGVDTFDRHMMRRIHDAHAKIIERGYE